MRISTVYRKISENLVFSKKSGHFTILSTLDLTHVSTWDIKKFIKSISVTFFSFDFFEIRFFLLRFKKVCRHLELLISALSLKLQLFDISRPKVASYCANFVFGTSLFFWISFLQNHNNLTDKSVITDLQIFFNGSMFFVQDICDL